MTSSSCWKRARSWSIPVKSNSLSSLEESLGGRMPWDDEDEEEAEVEEDEDGTAPAPPAAEAAARVVDEAERGWDACRLVAAARAAPAGEARGGGRCDDAAVEEEEELMFAFWLDMGWRREDGQGNGGPGKACLLCGCTLCACSAYVYVVCVRDWGGK